VGNTPCAPQLREERGKVPPLHQLEPLHPKRKKVYKATTPPQIIHPSPIPFPSIHLIHPIDSHHHPLCHFSSFHQEHLKNSKNTKNLSKKKNKKSKIKMNMETRRRSTRPW
jgi:hypothetical protein